MRYQIPDTRYQIPDTRYGIPDTRYQISAKISPFRKGGLRGILSSQPSTLNRRGFSLVEVMVAAIILGVSLLAIYGVYIKTFEASGRAEEKTIAISVAQSIMEEAINKPFANIALYSPVSPPPPSTFSVLNKDNTQVTENVVTVGSGSASDYVTYQQTINKIGINFSVTTIVSWHDDADDQTAPDDPDPNDYKRVHVTVTWPGTTAPVTLDRFISMYYRPNAQTTAGAEAGEFRLDDNSNYASLGSVNLEAYSGGNKTSKAEALGLSTSNLNAQNEIAWVEEFTDDDSGAEYPDVGHDEETDSTFSDSPIFLKTGGSTAARASAGAMSNIIGASGYSWHLDDILGSGLWYDWPSPPSWSTVWQQPSAIAKSDLNTGFYWQYTPVHSEGHQLFESGAAMAGTKSVITAESSNNKSVARSWSKIENVKILEMPGEPNGIISIGSVEASVEGEANGTAGGLLNTVTWRLTDFKVQGFANIPVVDSEDDIASITPLPAPIQSIEVGEITQNTDGGRAEASITALKIEIYQDAGILGSWGITIPAAKVNLGIAQTNVSYTTL